MKLEYIGYQDNLMSLHDQVNAKLMALFDGASDQRAALNEGLRLLGSGDL